VLGCIIAASGVQRFVQVTVIVGLFSGVGTWLVGPAHTVHIGASGLVFGYLGYLFLRGYWERSLSAILIAVAAGVLYGSALWGILPLHRGVSWEGHLFGFAGGATAASAHRRQRSRPAI
jgi:membrane associated rhomboid family serine protease